MNLKLLGTIITFMEQTFQEHNKTRHVTNGMDTGYKSLES